ncbi:MAG TPA: inositol monophosphatase family protein [Egibacteraceae bacterium]|nr:inositol monophosphatase family protein [Egibacteraceae bacterium]
MTPYSREYRVATLAAREAGALLRAAFGNVRDVRYKGLVDPVTAADRASEALIAERLLAAFPGDRLLAEEGSAAALNEGAERVWVVDPLDGTVNFLHSYPVFCVSIALIAGARTVVGVVYDPLRDELFAAQAGHGATLNDSPLAVSATDTLLRAMLCTGFAYDPAWRQENLAYFARFIELTQGVRRDGAAALDVAYVAAGRFDGYWERGVAVWDVAAAALILSEAGGRLSRYDGGDFDPFSREIVASNGLLHAALLDVIASVPAAPGVEEVNFT